MKADQLSGLKDRRAELARVIDALKADPEHDVDELHDIEQMVDGIDQLLRKAEQAPKRAPKHVQCRPAPSTSCTDVVEVGRIKATARSAVRVCVVDKAGARAVDLRFWFQPKDSDELVPSRKGVRVDPSKIDALIDALMLAKQHLPSAEARKP